MNVMQRLSLIAGLAVLTGCASTSTETKPSNVVPAPVAGKKADKPPKPPEPRVSEFDQMITVCALKGEQLEKFEAQRQARDKAWADYQASDKAKQLSDLRTALSAAKKANETDKVAALEKKIEPLAAAEWEYRSKLRANVMGVLTLDQQKQWAGFVLNARVLQAFRRTGLTDDQVKQVRVLCDKAAAAAIKEDTVSSDPYLQTLSEAQASVIEEIKAKVLTAEQRDKMAPKPATGQK
jgi:Spy/CpxP family protein refolding chaperone